jgi:hypothetical protein
MNINEMRDEKTGELPAHTWPGGYPILYLDGENNVLCAKCATKSHNDSDEFPKSKPVAFYIHYEGTPDSCDQCGIETESAYGDSTEEEEAR